MSHVTPVASAERAKTASLNAGRFVAGDESAPFEQVAAAIVRAAPVEVTGAYDGNHKPGEPGDYPDFGCSFEMYTDNKFLEMETLGPLATLGQGQSVTHTEHWSLEKGVKLNSISDEELDRLFKPLVK